MKKKFFSSSAVFSGDGFTTLSRKHRGHHASAFATDPYVSFYPQAEAIFAYFPGCMRGSSSVMLGVPH